MFSRKTDNYLLQFQDHRQSSVVLQRKSNISTRVLNRQNINNFLKRKNEGRGQQPLTSLLVRTIKMVMQSAD